MTETISALCLCLVSYERLFADERPPCAKRRHELSRLRPRSLAGPEPDRQTFAKFKHLSRKAAARKGHTFGTHAP
jgi:hypothetical protein